MFFVIGGLALRGQKSSFLTFLKCFSWSGVCPLAPKIQKNDVFWKNVILDVFRPRDYRETLRRSKLCRVDKFSDKMDRFWVLLCQKYIFLCISTQKMKHLKKTNKSKKVLKSSKKWQKNDKKDERGEHLLHGT